MIWLKLIGAYFVIEGAANLIYWYVYGNGVKDNGMWQLGRALRMFLGLLLILFG